MSSDSAVLSPKHRLSAEGKRAIAHVAGAMPGTFLTQALMAWLIIFGAIYVGLHAQSIPVTIVCIIVIATRQNILCLLTHEQAHYLGSRSKYGDWLCNIFISYPLLVLSVEGYAKVHLTHHRHFFTQKDPDFLRKNGEDWTLPLPRRKLLRLFVRDLLGLSIVDLITGKNVDVPGYEFPRKHPTPRWFKLAYYLTAALILTWAGVWDIFLLYWVLPLVTVLQIIVRWGALCEHVYGTENAAVEDCSPVILNRWWEKLLLPNLNFTLHTYHHYFPGVSFSKLPLLHEIFTKEGLVNEKLVFDGYGAYLDFISKPGNVVKT